MMHASLRGRRPAYSPRGPRLVIDRDLVLGEWKRGKPSPEIAERLRCERSIVEKIVIAARKQGDPRAVRRRRLDGEARS